MPGQVGGFEEVVEGIEADDADDADGTASGEDEAHAEFLLDIEVEASDGGALKVETLVVSIGRMGGVSKSVAYIGRATVTMSVKIPKPAAEK